METAWCRECPGAKCFQTDPLSPVLLSLTVRVRGGRHVSAGSRAPSLLAPHLSSLSPRAGGVARALAHGVGPSRCLAGGGAAPCLGGPLWSCVQEQPLYACVSKQGLQVASDPPAASLSWAFSSLPLAVRGFGSLREGSRHAGYRSFFSEAPRLLFSGIVNLWAGHKLDLDGVVLMLGTLSCQPG